MGAGTQECEVLVVGAGPVGLALSIELGSRGVRVLAVERSARGGSAPRAKTTNVRTRTHLRRWGIADRLADASPFGVSYPNDILFVTSLAGHRIAHFRNAFNAAPTRSPDYPEHAQWVPQYTLEKVLREHAQTLPTVELRFGTSFRAAEQDSAGVTSILRDAGGAEQRVTSRYLAGADGSRSAVRDVIGAKLVGRERLARHYNVVLRAPELARAHAQPPAVMYWQLGPRGVSIVGPMDRDGRWFFMPPSVKEGEVLSDAQVAEALSHSTGIATPVEILSSDEWIASELLADRYRRGRIFLAGDACHLHPPFGGYGMNMGVGDGVDLGWKLSAVLAGWGGETLLESYEAERRPVHQAVIDEAVANHATLAGPLWRDGLADDGPASEALRREVGERLLASKSREFHTLGTVLGLGYEDSPLNAGEGGPPPARNGQVYRPTARPGYLAPHAWLPDGRSLYDAFGPGFSLVVADGAEEAEVANAVRDAHALGVPLEIVRPAGVPVAALYDAPLALVRPDQHVAWRGARWTSPLRRATGRGGE